MILSCIKINLVQDNVKKTISNMVSAFKNLVKSGDITVKKTDVKTQNILDGIDGKKYFYYEKYRRK